MSPRGGFEKEWAELVRVIDAAELAAEDANDVRRIKRVSRALGESDVIGALAHDVKDPLASLMMGIAQLQRMDNAQLRAALVNISSAAKRLDRIVENTRQLEALRRGEHGYQVRAFPLASTVAHLVEKLRGNARGIRIEARIEAPSVRAFGDPHATTRLLEEVLDNAIGFSPDNGVVLVVVEMVPPHVLVQVADEGPGIDDAHLAHVFDEAMNRGHKPRRGPGRGLPLAAALAEAQSGRLRVEKRNPAGSAAILELRAA